MVVFLYSGAMATNSTMPLLLLVPGSPGVALQGAHTALTVLALGTNCVSLVVIYGVVSRLTPPLQLLTSLAFSDMLAPWAVMTQYFPASACQEEIHTALLLTAHNAAALALIVLAGAHHLATFRPLHYDKLVTARRVWITINVVWIVAILSAHVHFLSTLAHHHYGRGGGGVSFCISVQRSLGLALMLAASYSGALAVLTAAIYGRMLMHLRPIELQASSPRRSSRSVMTGMALAAVHLLCWLPYLVTKFKQVDNYGSSTLMLVNGACQAVVLVSCCFDPVVYGLRMTNMQTGYHRLYQRARGAVVQAWRRMKGERGDHDDQPSTPLNPIESIC